MSTLTTCSGDFRNGGTTSGTAHRPVRADHARGGARVRHRPPPVGLRAVPPPAARGPPLRRGGRRRAGPRRDRGVPVQRRGARLPPRARIVDEPTLDYLADYRFTGDIWGYAEGETYFPCSPLDGGGVDLRRGGAARDRAAVDLQPRLGDRLGGLPDDLGRRRPAVHRDGLAAYARAGGGGVRPGGVHRRLHGDLQPARPPGVRRADQRAPARTRSRCCTTPRRTRSAPRSSRSARAPRCWSTPTTSPRPCGSGSRSPDRSWVRCGSTPVTSGMLAHQVRAQLDELGAPDTKIIVTSDLDEFAIAGLASAPVDGYGVGTQLVTGSGHPTSGFVYKLVARENDAGELVGGGQEEQGQDLGRRPQVRVAPPLPRRRRPGRGDRHRAAGGERRRRPARCWSRS